MAFAPGSAVLPAPSGSSFCGTQHVLFEDDSVHPLRTIDISRTFLARLCGRVDDIAFNARVLATTRRLHIPAHVAALLYLVTVLVVFVVADRTVSAAVSYMSCAMGILLVLYVAASLSWDMLRLLVPTFEFAFLFSVNALNAAMWTEIFNDARRFVMLVAGACYALSLCADANIYTRHLFTRVLVVGSTAVPAVLATVVLQYVPNINNPSYQVLGVAISAVDLQVSGSLIIGFFTMKRVQRMQRLVFSRAPLTQIQCDMYLPLCHLVPQAQRRASRQLTVAEASSLDPQSQCQPLLLIDECAAHGIDVTRTLFPTLSAARRTYPFLINACGAAGVVCFAVMPFVQPPDLSKMEPTAFFVGFLALVASLCFTLSYVVHLQPRLARRVSLEIDAWFVSFHTTVVAVCVGDAVHWDGGRQLWPWTAWVWCHWVLYLDAVTPQTRRRLGFSRRFTLLVIALLFAYPVVVTYWLYLSPVRPTLRNRVIVEFSFGRRQRLRVDVLGFLASKLFTLWVWTGRFLWRELLRPPNTYRLLKRHAAYRVPF